LVAVQQCLLLFCFMQMERLIILMLLDMQLRRRQLFNLPPRSLATW